MNRKPLHFHELVTLVWYIIDAITHLTIELAYVVIALGDTAEKTDNFFGWLWREYGRADARWAVRDANVISLEILTVGIGILCLLQVWGVWYRSSWRHPLQIIICTAELYGGWMTFAPEWVDGSPNLEGQDPILFWIYLVFMNGLWVVVPLILLWDSFTRMTHISEKSAGVLEQDLNVSDANNKIPGAPSFMVFYIMAGFIVVYNILVPAVLFTAPGVEVRR